MNKLLKYSITSGIILGLLLSVYSLLTYVMKINTLGFGFQVFDIMFRLFVVSIFFTISGKMYRKTFVGGFISYWKAYINLLLTGTIAALVISIYQFIISIVGDISYLKPYANKLILQLERMGAEQEQLDTVYKSLQEYLVASPISHAGNVMFSEVIFMAILALIVAIFIRKKQAMFKFSEQQQ